MLINSISLLDGLSIGSVGGRDNNDVQNITFENVIMENSQQSVRIVSPTSPTVRMGDLRLATDSVC